MKAPVVEPLFNKVVKKSANGCFCKPIAGTLSGYLKLQLLESDSINWLPNVAVLFSLFLWIITLLWCIIR